jgi:Rps23 Pro-64 3,4-dihydroxylase Tpa1-like proline 4-hydroxylase
MNLNIALDNDIETLKEEFNNKKKVIINKILIPEFAEILLKYSLLDKNWVLAAGIDKVRYENKIDFQNQKKNDMIGLEVNKAYSQNRFSYIFHRTMNNRNPSYVEQNLRHLLESKDFINFLNSVTDMNLTKLTTMFMSRYRSGHFLSPHSDKGNGRLAFVISLSKDWKPQYGGLLHFLSQDRETIIDTYCSIFNNMIIFGVDELDQPHFVSHVSPNVLFNRISIGGWYE